MNISFKEVCRKYEQITGREMSPDTVSFAKIILSQLDAGDASAALVWAIICSMLEEDTRQQMILAATA